MRPPEIPGQFDGGRYVDLQYLQSGGMAHVFRATDTRTGRPCAIKVLDERFAGWVEGRSRFLAEGRAMQALDHPHVIRVDAVGVEGDRWPYLVMEYAAGGTLHDRCVNGEGVPPAEAIRYVVDLLTALGAAHALGIVHRDVKPSNALFTEDGTLKLADFGLAKVTGGVSGPIDHRTRTGQGLGTVGYQAPELRSDARSATPAADLYAAGALLFTLVRGYEPPDLTLAAPDAPLFARHDPRLVALVQRCIAVDPGARPPSARALIEELGALHQALTGEADPSPRWLATYDASLVPPARAGCVPAWLARLRPGRP